VFDWGDYDGGCVLVPVRDAFQFEPEPQFDDLGFGFQPFDAGDYVLGGDDFCAIDSVLHRVVLQADVGQDYC
jgi:hypothetical protein